jgi:hypothetical protein
MSNERKIFTKYEADILMKPGEYVHTFKNSIPGVMLGCDMKRSEILKAVHFEKAGDNASRMGHGLVAWMSEKDGDFIFVETE